MGFNPRKEFGTDSDLEVNGVWQDIGDGARVRVARWNNPAHKKVLERLRKKFRHFQMAGRDIPDEEAEKITVESMVEAILLDWDGFVDDDGKELKYSRNAAFSMLEIKDFRDLVAGLSLAAEIFRKKEVEEIAKNSVKG